jgi:glycosyltransferase involved in cell wall biosynthesis
MSVGRLVPEKGIPVLLEAGKILKAEGHDFEIRIIGDGSERPKLEEFIQWEKLEPLVRGRSGITLRYRHTSLCVEMRESVFTMLRLVRPPGDRSFH